MSTVLEPTSAFATVNGLRLRYLDYSPASVGKPPVMLLHGLAMFAHTWDHNAAVLRDDLHVISVDQRGHGESDRGACEDYRTAVFASDILGLADALGWQRFSLVGQSMGGHNSMYVAATHPERVEKLVISDMEPIMRIELIAYMRNAERLPEYDSLDDVFNEAVSRNPRPTAELQRHRAEHTVKRLPNGRLTPLYDLNAPRCWESQDLWSMLGQIQCPTLLLRGEESPVLQRDVAARMVAAIPNCEFVEIKGAAHSIGLDNPKDFDAAVRGFLLS